MIFFIKKLVKLIYDYIYIIYIYSDKKELVENLKKKKDTLIIPADYPGGLGDHAMVKSFTSNVLEKPTYLFYSKNRNRNRNRKFLTYSKFSLPSEVINEIGMFKKCIFFGADILDGKINLSDAIFRLKLAKIFSKYAETRIISFSINKNIHPLIKKEISEKTNINFYLRDINSFNRMQKINPRIELSADIAFLLKPKKNIKFKKVLEWIKESDEKIIGINLHPHLLKFYKKNEFDKVIKCLNLFMRINNNSKFLFLSHDFRKNQNDILFMKKIFKNYLKNKNFYFLDLKFKSNEVKYLVSKLDFLISARMHLAISALSCKVVTMIIDYQDKSEGLLKFFSLHRDCLISKDMEEKLILKKLNNFVNKKKMIKKKIIENLPQVIKLAKKNIYN